MTDAKITEHPAPAVEAIAGVSALSFAGGLRNQLRMLPILVALIGLIVGFSLLTPDFLSPRNTTNLFLQVVPVGILALAFIFVIFVSEVDLSLALSSAVSAAIMGTLLVDYGWPLPVTLAIGLVAGAVIACFQAKIFLLFGAPSFLVTLGGALLLEGLLIVLLPPRSANVSLFGTPLEDLGVACFPPGVSWVLWAIGNLCFGALRAVIFRASRRRQMAVDGFWTVAFPVAATAIASALMIWQLNQFNGVPLLFSMFLLVLIAASYLTTQTRFGIHLFAVGGNREAARRAGVPVQRVVMLAFMLAGVLAAIAGYSFAVRQVGVSTTSGSGLVMLQSIAAAVIGGASLFGGRGSVLAAFIGAAVLAVIANGLELLGVSVQWRLMAQGSVLVIAIVIDSIVSRGRVFAR